MAILDNQFDEKYKLLPEEVRLYFSSEYNGQVTVSLADEYKIDIDDIYALVFLTVNSGFDLKIARERVNSFNLTGVSLRRFWADFLGRIFLPLMPYIENKEYNETSVYNEIKNSGGNPDNYGLWLDIMDNVIDESNGEFLDEILKGFEEGFDEKEEHDYVIDLLSGSIVEILKTKSLPANLALNSGLIYLLFNYKGFKEEAAKMILNSKELIGKKNIVIEGREVAPSIANWIKDFIKINGSNMFGDIILAQYLDTSTNVDKLSIAEKDILSGALHFYKNVSFFPESMDNIPAEDWRIFPFAASKEEVRKQREPLTASTPMAVISPVTEKVATPEAVVVAPKEEPKELSESEKNFLAGISILMEAKKNYLPDSLEYKAIEEEIKRLKVKK